MQLHGETDINIAMIVNADYAVSPLVLVTKESKILSHVKTVVYILMVFLFAFALVPPSAHGAEPSQSQIRQLLEKCVRLEMKLPSKMGLINLDSVRITEVKITNSSEHEGGKSWAYQLDMTVAGEDSAMLPGGSRTFYVTAEVEQTTGVFKISRYVNQTLGTNPVLAYPDEAQELKISDS